MKTKYLFSIIISFNIILGFAQNEEKQSYYYYRGEKIMLPINKNRFVVYFEEDSAFESIIRKDYNVVQKIGSNNNLTTVLKKRNICGLELIIDDSRKYNEIYNSLKKLSNIITIAPQIGDSLPVRTSNLFYVKLKNEKDTLLLKQIAKETNTEIIRKVKFSSNWYALKITKKSKSHALDISNIFAETNYFDKVDPNFIFNFSPSCVSDSNFYQQWAYDSINGCEAWNITTGSNDVIVAIIDHGIDNSHREFNGVNFTNSFDAVSCTSPAKLYGNHGTNVCGIISCNHNLNKIAGIAPGLSIMEVSQPLVNQDSLSEQLAIGINWAVQNGADILNNSWGDRRGYIYRLHSAMLEDAIDFALDNGRANLGCVVVFATGNIGGNTIDYPASYRNEILAVGNYSKFGKRNSDSNYGTKLDIVAPGLWIYTTDLNNTYAPNSSGTSISAPFVSGIAGLILSRNPQLFGSEVVDIIESTAQKVGGYSYQDTTGRPNGTWDIEMGYGLVDAFAVASYCRTIDILNSTISFDYEINECNVNVQNVNVINNSKFTIDITNKATINGPFQMTIGSKLEIK